MDALERYINRVAYKFPKGYPDVNDPQDMKMLMEMVSSIVEAEEEKSKITKNDLVNLIKDLDLDDDPCTDDGIFCTNDVCDNGFCVNNPLDDDTPCPDNDDGIFCTDEVCFSGACINDPVDLNCEIWEDCDGLVPVNDGCVQNNCSSCENCVDWYGDRVLPHPSLTSTPPPPQQVR